MMHTGRQAKSIFVQKSASLTWGNVYTFGKFLFACFILAHTVVWILDFNIPNKSYRPLMRVTSPTGKMEAVLWHGNENYDTDPVYVVIIGIPGESEPKHNVKMVYAHEHLHVCSLYWTSPHEVVMEVLKVMGERTLYRASLPLSTVFDEPWREGTVYFYLKRVEHAEHC